MNARALGSRFRTAVVQCAGIDARALAAFRMALGALLLADLLLRVRNLTAFYTDSGVLPRSLLAERAPLYAAYSIHAVSGAAWAQALLFAAAGVAAVALLLGYRTTLATVVSVVLLASLHARNTFVLNGGDALFRQLLFWSAFLPLGARWSVDAAQRNDAEPPDALHRVVGVASAALLVQVVLVYAVNAALKLRGESWVEGDAVQYVFSLDQFTILLGDALAQYPVLLEVAAHVWLAMLVLSPLLLVLRGWPRAAFAGLFAGAHLGMLLTMRLGLFPLISMAALLPFLPPAVWDRVSVPSVALADDLADVLPAFADRSLPARLRRWANTVVPPALACLLVVILVWNAATLGVVAIPDAVNPEPGNERPDYRWSMFAPEPLSTDGWLVAPGKTESGARVDAFHGGRVAWAKPPDVAASYPTARWRKYISNVWRGDGDTLERGFAGYLCGRWNATHEADLVNVTLYYVAEQTRLDGPDPTERVRLHSESCDRA